VSLVVRTPQGERTIVGSHILVATGRTPNTHGMGLDIAGVELDHHGFVKVNHRLETTAPDIWAIGEQREALFPSRPRHRLRTGRSRIARQGRYRNLRALGYRNHPLRTRTLPLDLNRPPHGVYLPFLNRRVERLALSSAAQSTFRARSFVHGGKNENIITP
jgi:hypothetical protein